MQAGFIGLGKMGKRMTSKLALEGFDVIGYDTNPKVREYVGKEIKVTKDLKELIDYLNPDRKIMMMIPAGKPVEQTVSEIYPNLTEGDIVVDAGNSYYKDSIRRAKLLEGKNAYFLDVGTSGGLRGAEIGLSFTVGGKKEAYEKFKPVFETLAAKDGLCYVGESGSGHYVKMVHNAIEYGMLQAYAEGFELLSKSQFNLNLSDIAHVWNQGGITRSYILELAEDALKNEKIENVKGVIEGGETGRWAIEEAWEKGVPFSSITTAFESRLRSRQEDPFSDKFIALLRNKFGGHEIQNK